MSSGFNFGFQTGPFPPTPEKTRRDSGLSTHGTHVMPYYPHFVMPPTDQVFTAAPGQDFRKWLRRWAVTHEKMPDGSAREPGDWVEELWSCIEGDAALRVKRDNGTRVIIQMSPEDVTAEHKTQFKTLLLELFPTQDEEPQDSPGAEIMSMTQSGSSLWDFYQSILLKVKMAGSSDASPTMSVAASAILDMAVKSFCEGLDDKKLVISMTGYEFEPGRSLRGAYQKAESEARKIKRQADWNDKVRDDQMAVLNKQMTEFLLHNQPVPHHLIQQARDLVRASGNQPSIEYPAVVPMALPGPIQAQVFQTHPREQARQPVTPPITDQVNRQTQNMLSNAPMMSGGLDPSASTTRTQRQPYDLSGFDPTTSDNPFVSGRTPYEYERGNPLCTRCGQKLGHLAKDCDQRPLKRPEQEYLRNMIRENIEQWQASRSGPATGSNAIPIGSRLAEIYNADTSAEQECMSADDASYTEDDSSARDHTSVYRLVEYDDLGEEVYADEVERPAKRNRPGEESEDEVPALGPDGRPKKRPKGKGVGRKARELTKINGMILEAPMDVRENLKSTNVVLPFLHLAQLSPYFRSEVKRLLGVPRKPRKPKAKAPTAAEIPTTQTTVASLTSDLSGLKVSEAITKGIEKWKMKDRTQRA